MLDIRGQQSDFSTPFIDKYMQTGDFFSRFITKYDIM